MANPIHKVYEFTLLYQLILFLLFILDNYASLDNVSVHVSILAFDTTFTINFYLFLIILGAIYTGLILAGISVVDSGLSDPSLNKLGKFLRLSFIFAILFIPIAYYVQFINELGIIIEIVIFAIYLLEGFYNLGVDNE